jgi:hypothetical protein
VATCASAEPHLRRSLGFSVERRAMRGVGIALGAVVRVAPTREARRGVMFCLHPDVEELERIQLE